MKHKQLIYNTEMSSRAEEEERQGEQARHRFYYSPCSLFEHAIKAFLKCLGLHDDHHDYHSGGSAVTDDQNHHHPHPHPHPHPDPHTEREMKFTVHTHSLSLPPNLLITILILL